METIRPSETSLSQEPHAVPSQKRAFFIVTAKENLKSYIALTGWGLWRRHNLYPVRYELGFYIPEDAILHSHRRENLKS
jgi:hypothetical protein